MKQIKRLLIPALALLLIFSLMACGGGNGNTTPPLPGSNENSNSPSPGDPPPSDTAPEQNTPSADNKPSDSSGSISEVVGNLFDWTKTGTYYYETETTSTYGDSVSHYNDIRVKDGDDYASVSVEKDADGTVTRRIHTFKKGEKIVVINDLEKTYMEVPPELMALSEGVQDAFSEMTKISEGTGEINGKTLRYEEYDTGGISSKYFFDNGQVYGYTSELDFGDEKITTVSIITKQSNKVSAELFQIPAGYTEMKP